MQEGVEHVMLKKTKGETRKIWKILIQQFWSEKFFFILKWGFALK